MKYTGLPAAGAGSLNEAGCPDGAGVPRAASRAHELAGLVTPGKAVNVERCVVAPVSRMVPLKAMSPGMAFRFAADPVPRARLALAGAGATVGEEADDDELEPADGVLSAAGEPDELHAATATASSRPAAAARPRATAGRITRTAGTGEGDCMKGV